MNKIVYSVVFVVLVYRNTQDLKDFFLHNKVKESHTIVVNSFYDDASETEFKQIAVENGASFISVPNKGYGAGNNRGIEYAIENFDFRYLVVSNADVMIERFEIQQLEKYGDAIIAPKIVNLSNRNQNPSVPFAPFKWYERMRYVIYKGNHRKLIYLAFVYSRLTKMFYYCISCFRQKIFSAHGAFYIISRNALNKLIPLYNEEMFLFNEEEHLGRKARQHGIDTYYAPELKIRHKEDGSMKVASLNEFQMLRQSYLIYYGNWIKE